MNAFKLSTATLLMGALFLSAPVVTAASSTAKAPSCTVKTPSTTIAAGGEAKISWKAKNAKSVEWTQDSPNTQLNLTGTVKKKGKKTVAIPVSNIGNAYKVILAVTGKDGTISFCSGSIITGTESVTTTEASSASTIDTASLKAAETGPVTVSGTAPPNATLEIYLAYPTFTGLTDYKNMRANTMFSR